MTMRLAVFIKKRSLEGDPRIEALRSELEAGGCELYDVKESKDLREGTDALLSLGGDGTFLFAARIAGYSGIPVLGINFGRLGFLSEYKPEEAVSALLSGRYSIEKRALLRSEVSEAGVSDIALNEVTVHRVGAAMLGVDVLIDGEPLPTCWADGFLVATSSGSTAYSLSVGGPICSPDTGVFIIAPIAPHNLNVRPLLVPETSRVRMTLKLRDTDAILSADNCAVKIGEGTEIEVEAAPEKLQVARLGGSNFIQALCSRLLWGDDVRNSK